MRPSRRLLFPLAALLGAAVVVLPAVASSETSPTIMAVNHPGGGYYGETHEWSPPTATVGVGGVVSVSNPTEVRHGVEWVGGPAAPSCSGVPVGANESASATKWSGTCTFTQAGTYTFYCTVHHAAMTATVIVNTTPTPPPTTSPTFPESGNTPPSAPATSGSQEASGSLLAGSASAAVKLPAVEHGKSVRGSVDVSGAGSGGKLEVDLLAKSASLASAHHASLTRVGRMVRSSLLAGTVPFSVALNARAKHALSVHRRLPLTVRILLTPAHGPVVTITRSVVERP